MQDVDWLALALSVRLGLATCLLLSLFVPLLVFAASLLPALWQRILSTSSLLSLSLPPTVLGFYALLLLSPQGILGQLVEGGLAFSFWGLVLACSLFNLPFMFSPLLNALHTLSQAQQEALQLLGRSRFYNFRKVIWPHIRPVWVLGICVCFAHCMGEFGVVMMVGGSIPNETKVFSVAIYELVEQLEYEKAHKNAAVMLLLAFVIAFLTSHLGSKLKA
ncbi:MAG: ABC transporter permease subunit [Cytophagales bacterium]|nr:MAG: ABC transporter permease subunit [Cytophagales bacterium]TAF61697.1 MAG: ABC transporter permease subunit [Cytophagales bacterium]